MKTIVGVNTLESVSSFAYSSHCKLWIQMKKDFPDDEFILYTPYRMSIDNMRNDVARIAIEHDCDYILFLDDDVCVVPNTYKSLREADKDIVAAMTYVRGYPFHPMCFKDYDTVDTEGKRRLNLTFHDDYETVLDKETGLFRTGAVGFSCVLIKVDLLKCMNPPYFVTGPGHTEDVYFCLRARLELEPEPQIFVDTKVPTGHLLMPEMVSTDNVEALREHYKKVNDKVVVDTIDNRKPEYLDKVREELLENAPA